MSDKVDAKVSDVNIKQQGCVDVIDNDTLCGCPVERVSPDFLRRAIVKVPVVLGEYTVNFNILSTIELENLATEIKDIKKNLRITEAMLIGNTNVLFIKGYIRKNIMYARANSCITDNNCEVPYNDDENSQGYCGNIRHCTVNVPFNFTTTLTNLIVPPATIINNDREEFQFFRKGELGPEFAGKDSLLSGDFTEYNQVSSEYFNELPYIELISSRIVEYDEYLNRNQLVDNGSRLIDNNNELIGEIEFDTIEEKIVVSLTFKVLQKRQVGIGDDF